MKRGTAQPAIRRAVVMLGATLLLLSSCSDADDEAETLEPGVLSIVAPEDGSTVSGPVTVTMVADDFVVEAAGEVRSNAGHLHLMIDVGCVTPGEVIPADGSHLHLGDGRTEVELDLQPGEYTLCAQAGDGVHTALALTDTVTISVE